MDCANINNLLIDYIDDNLNINLRKEVEGHISACPDCKLELDQMRTLLTDMNSIEDQFPSEDMKVRFTDMLKEEKRALNIVDMKTEEKDGFIIRMLSSGWGQASVGAAVLIIGFLLGFVFQLGSGGDDYRMLEKEINIMKQILMLSKLEETSASERMQAVSLIEEQDNTDPELVSALIGTLNNDKNVNVRMAAANALAKYYNANGVKDALLSALKEQKDPLMQITLINLFVEVQEKSAVDQMQMLVIDQESPDVVKTQAQKGIRALI
jgi:hypothetical protein